MITGHGLFRHLIFVLFFTFSQVAFSVPRYDRGEWKHWIDDDLDCQNTRHELLIATSEVQVTFRTERQCTVASGQWYGPYTNRVYRSASQLDVDHLVPLGHAHYAGGYSWSSELKQAFANDPENLIPVNSSENRRKGNKGPDRYRPPNREYWCAYARRWKAVKAKYGLSVSSTEARALAGMIEETCIDAAITQ